MKLKELFEESTIFPEFVIKFINHYNIKYDDRKRITKKFEKYPNCSFQEVDEDTITLIFQSTSRSFFKEDNLEDILYDVKDEMTKLIDDIDDNSIQDWEAFLSFESTLPTYPTEYPYIEITLDPNADLSNLYTNIGHCKELTLHNIDRLKHTKGLINLLKIKTDKTWLRTSASKPKWVDIYQQHMNLKSPRNLQKCIEELKDSGFNEYV